MSKTASVVADVIDVTRTLTTDTENRVPHLAFQPGELSDMPVLPIDEVVTAYYLRLKVDNRPGVIAAISGILSEHDISIEAIQQKEHAEAETQVPLVMLTHSVRELQMVDALRAIEELDVVAGEVTRIRLEQLG